jgi:hypothetical protein
VIGHEAFGLAVAGDGLVEQRGNVLALRLGCEQVPREDVGREEVDDGDELI